MSGIYLVLRRRLEDVVDWVELGTELMWSSRKARGYSYEAMGRLLNVAAKTYERWEKRGCVPRHMLDQVAEVLDLELERPPRLSVAVADGDGVTLPPLAFEALLQTQDAMIAQLEAIATAQDAMSAQLEAALEERLPARRVPARRRKAG